MVLHAGRRIERPGVIRTTTLCGRMNARSRDGMNIAGTDESVTCKFCLAKMRGPVPVPVASASSAEPGRNRYVATPKPATTPGTAPEASADPNLEPSDDL